MDIALELQQRGFVKGEFPLFVGSSSDGGASYEKFLLNSRSVADVSVSSVEEKLKMHLDRQGCGLPYSLNRTVKSVVEEVVSNQGAFLVGDVDQAMESIAGKVCAMVNKTV